jgi:cation transport regulator ChaB
MPAKDEMPATLKRSPAKAQRTWAKSHDSAVETYGEGERAHRTAFAALKHSFEKVGDRWQPKKGGKTYGGVDVVGNSRETLYERAKALGVKGRSKMSKEQLGEAIARKQ